jgi:hypothetical protein
MNYVSLNVMINYDILYSLELDQGIKLSYDIQGMVNAPVSPNKLMISVVLVG